MAEEDNGNRTRDTEQERSWHAMSAEEVLESVESGSDGLASDTAEERLDRDGPNTLEEQGDAGLGEIALRQVRNPLIYMLLTASVVSLLVGHLLDAGVIVAVVLLNATIGVVQEWRAEEALSALRALAAPQAMVVRDGESKEVPADEVVVGDVLEIESGHRVAADARLLEARDLRIDESALTGESSPVTKDTDPVDEDTPLAERSSMVWMSTPVSAGRGRAVVVAAGMDTAMGEIAGEMREAERARTPLQQRIDRLSIWIGVFAGSVAVTLFVLGLLRGFEAVEMLLFAAAAAVSAIPEGLPAVVSVVLAARVRLMADRGALIRRLPAVETLGSTTVICSDKTGTITLNQMTVKRVWTAGAEYEVSGEGLSSEGEIREAADDADESDPVEFDGEDDANRPLRMLLRIGLQCNDAEVEDSDDGRSVKGDPTEGALLVVAAKAGLDDGEDPAFRRTDDIPFSSEHKYMVTLDEPADGSDALPVPLEDEMRMHVKGAVEVLLDASTHILENGERSELDDETRERIREAEQGFAEDALRVIAGAYRDVSTTELDHSDIEDLTFVGLWGMLDPPRPAAIEAIEKTQEAGIRVVMITGDFAPTARAIAEESGIAEHDQEVLTGRDLDDLSDEELKERVADVAVFARADPTHKLRIVQALMERGEVVAVTGDGVNDAPALKESSIGVAMGETGTEVAKEAADMVLTDDNFETIVAAVEQGRVLFGNLRRVIKFLVTTNVGEILALTGAILMGLPLPLTAVMILWVNLVTDGVTTIPLGLEPQHGNVLADPPRAQDAGVIDRPALIHIVAIAPVIAIGTLGMFWYQFEMVGHDHERAQTIAFTTLVAFEWFRGIGSRSDTLPLPKIGLLTNKWLLLGISCGALLQVIAVHWGPAQVAFGTVGMTLDEWLLALAVASSVLIIEEARKWIYQARKG